MDLVKEKGDCCGCRTCEKVCPEGAVTMEADACGFLYPKIDPEKCIDCGLCLKKCAFQSGYQKRKEFEPFYAYGARHKDEKVYMESRSGGAFTALSDQILARSGAVYGAAFDAEKGAFYVRHEGTESQEGRDRFRGSKYVQSDLGDVFPEIKKRLDDGQTVLFTGTGCQVGALYAYLPRGYDNLYTMDLVCYGVMSPKVWTDFLHMREREKGGKIQRAEFRDKKACGWKAHKETVVIGGKAYTSRIFSRLFSRSLVRPSCFQCIYTNKERVGDITLADFWGHEDAIPGKWDDDRGISLVLVNTAHGKELWEAAEDALERVDVTGYPFRHSRMRTPTKKPESYDRFWEDYEREGFRYCAKKYADHKKHELPGHMLKKILRRSLGKLKGWLRMSWYLFFYERDALKSSWILIDSKNGKDLGSNMLRIAEVLAKDPVYRKYRLFISCSRDKRADIRAMMDRYGLGRAKLIRENGFRYTRVAALAGYLFTDTSFPLWFAKKDGQVITNTWHGTPLKLMGKDVKDRAFDMGNVQKNHLMADYLVYPTEYMKECMASAYFLDNLYKGKILYSGYPRNAVFSDPERGEELRRKLGLEGKRLYSYMPTWRGVLKHIDARENTDPVVHFLAELDKGLTDDEIFFVRLHPFIGNAVSFSGYRHVRPFPRGYDPYDILNMCDRLVTDYSSVMFDYANTRKKVILFVYDREAYMDERGVYVSIDTFPFPQVRRVDELLEELRTPKRYDDSGFRERFCTYDREDAAQGLCRHIIRGEKVFEEYEADANGRENVLIYSGGLKRNGLTTALLDLFAKIDLGRRDYYVTFRSEDLREEPERVGLLPEAVGFYPIASTRNESLGEGIAAYLYYKKDRSSPLVMKKLDRYYRRLYQSSFGLCDFSCVIQYAGYGKGIINLFRQAPCMRVIFVHNDMVRELESKDNQHKLTLQRAYSEFERVVPVTEDICPPTRELGGEAAHIQVVNNCHDHEGVLERAKKELVFDKDTECTVSRERLQEILEGGAKKFITIGRFSPEKGHDMLLEAFDRYHEGEPDSHLIIIGGYGELYAQTLTQAKALSCGSHVIVIRSISNPMPILKKCDLFILSSLYEGLGLVLLEADTLSVPAISTDVPGPRCFMKRYGGYLVPPNADGILGGLRAFDRGLVKVLGVDYEEYDREAVRQFEALFSEKGGRR